MLCVRLVAKTGNVVSSLVFLIPLPRSDCFCQHLFVCVSVYLHKTPVFFFSSLNSALRSISSSPNHHRASLHRLPVSTRLFVRGLKRRRLAAGPSLGCRLEAACWQLGSAAALQQAGGCALLLAHFLILSLPIGAEGRDHTPPLKPVSCFRLCCVAGKSSLSPGNSAPSGQTEPLRSHQHEKPKKNHHVSSHVRARPPRVLYKPCPDATGISIVRSHCDAGAQVALNAPFMFSSIFRRFPGLFSVIRCDRMQRRTV